VGLGTELKMEFAADVVCFSHLRWDLVLQRPNQLFGRCARERRTFFWEDPVFDPSLPPGGAFLELSDASSILRVAVPRIPIGLDEQEVERELRRLFVEMLAKRSVHRPVLWFTSPAAFGFAGHVAASAVVYDCADELPPRLWTRAAAPLPSTRPPPTPFASTWALPPPLGSARAPSALLGGAPFAPARLPPAWTPPAVLPPLEATEASLRAREADLLRRADVVFTAGHSLWQAKKAQHPCVYLFPSNVDRAHFARARAPQSEPRDQAGIPRPRLGYFGAVDENVDLDLLTDVADVAPSWHIVIIGPAVNIDAARLPLRRNIHYLGQRAYGELPAYIAGWDVALLPFVATDPTRFVNPVKALECLAAGKPVVATAVPDLVHPYGERDLVRTTDRLSFVAEIAAALGAPLARRAAADAFIARTSWDRTWREMWEIVEAIVRQRDACGVSSGGLDAPAPGSATGDRAPHDHDGDVDRRRTA